MRVLLTGADGYIGAIMGPKLIEAGHEVLGLDTGYYRRGWLFDDHKTHPQVISKDQRQITKADLEGVDAVVHLAELSNDPIGENDPDLTMDVNHRGSVGLARLAREAGVKRFIQASSCSTYGAGGDEMRTETSELAPQTAYARCKILVEQGVRELMDDDFTPVFMRNATAYGASPRQRFDLVLNNLCGFAHTIREIRMTSDGSPWRPITHIEDICEAMLCALKAPKARLTASFRSRGAGSSAASSAGTSASRATTRARPATLRARCRSSLRAIPINHAQNSPRSGSNCAIRSTALRKVSWNRSSARVRSRPTRW